jgi:hypothetical protein
MYMKSNWLSSDRIEDTVQHGLSPCELLGINVVTMGVHGINEYGGFTMYTVEYQLAKHLNFIVLSCDTEIEALKTYEQCQSMIPCCISLYRGKFKVL